MVSSLIRWAACCWYAVSDMSTLTFNTGVIHQIHVLYLGRLSVTRVNSNGKLTDFGCYAIVYLSHSIPFQCDLLQFVIVDLLSGDT